MTEAKTAITASELEAARDHECDCSNKREHEPWCDYAEDFSRTAEMDASEAKRADEKTANTSKFDQVQELLGSAPWGLWEKITRNPELTAAQIADAIKTGRL